MLSIEPYRPVRSIYLVTSLLITIQVCYIICILLVIFDDYLSTNTPGDGERRNICGVNNFCLFVCEIIPTLDVSTVTHFPAVLLSGKIFVCMFV